LSCDKKAYGYDHGCQLIFSAHCQTCRNLLPNQERQFIVPIQTDPNKLGLCLYLQHNFIRFLGIDASAFTRFVTALLCFEAVRSCS